MPEKRNFIRFDREVPAKFQLKALEDESVHYVRTKNICAGGAFLETNQIFSEGSEMFVEIVLPMENKSCFNSNNHCFVKLKGNVVRSEPAGIALSFHKEFQIDFGELPQHLINNPIYQQYLYDN